MMKNKSLIIKRTLAIVLAVAVLIFVVDFLNRLLTPKYMSGPLDGAFIAEYYKETTDHDVIFLGDCEVFSNISPVYLWENYGVTSFVRGSAQQLIWQSYYLLRDTLRYETPDIVVFNVLSLIYNEPQNEAYNRITLDGMRFSADKIGAVLSSMTEGESAIEYFLPFLRFHSRWSSLEPDDFKYLYKKDKVTHNGYYMRVDIKPVESLPTVRKLSDYTFGSRAMEYLDKILELCRKNGIELVLMKAPSLVPHWYDEWNAQVVDYADKNGLLYINVLAAAEEIGIDYKLDTFDAGMHMNLTGAEKVTEYIGSILTEKYPLTDHRGDTKYEGVWADKVKFYYDMIEAQKAELAEYGHLIHFGAAPKDNSK